MQCAPTNFLFAGYTINDRRSHVLKNRRCNSPVFLILNAMRDYLILMNGTAPSLLKLVVGN